MNELGLGQVFIRKFGLYATYANGVATYRIHQAEETQIKWKQIVAFSCICLAMGLFVTYLGYNKIKREKQADNILNKLEHVNEETKRKSRMVNEV